jgi:hypothetical protein
VAGERAPSLVIATVGTGGQIEPTNFAEGADFIVDVAGWFQPTAW